TSIFTSKGEARKMLQAGGVSVNKEKVQAVETLIDKNVLINDKYILVQKGKKNYFLIKVVQ
ncbi:MAG TPA: S4 domain-containing protein, partial [Bacteroidia bacterium]|nr:S4 domain-containing protein [Bacteroidia bacterium]